MGGDDDGIRLSGAGGFEHLDAGGIADDRFWVISDEFGGFSMMVVESPASMSNRLVIRPTRPPPTMMTWDCLAKLRRKAEL